MELIGRDPDAELPREEREIDQVDGARVVEVAARIVGSPERGGEQGEVGLVGVAVVVHVGGAAVAHAVPVAVGLIVVWEIRAVVAGVPEAVAVAVRLVGIRQARTVVDHVRDAVAVRVRVARGRASSEVGDEREVALPGLE